MKGRKFDFLDDVECIRRSNESYEFGIHDLPFGEFGVYANNVFFNRRRGDLSDVGDVIIDAYTRRKFSSDEGVVAQEFFWFDYSYSCACARDCLSEFESGYTLEFEEGENPAYLALTLFRRADESLRSAKKFSKLLDGSEDMIKAEYSICFSDLARERRRAYLAIEFPDNHKKLVDLDRAIQLEDYELAIWLRDERNKSIRFHPPNK